MPKRTLPAAPAGRYDRDHMGPPDPAACAEPAGLPAPLLAAAHALSTPARTVLFRAGERPRFIYFVLEGELRLVRHSRNGQEVILQRVRRGYVAEASLEAQRYHCDGVAAAPSRLLRFPRTVFLAQLEADARFRRAWLRHLADEVRRLRARCERLSLRGAAERIVHYIESEGGGALELHQSRKSWALELGLTHEALYRALAKLKSEGVLSIAGARLELRRPAARPVAR